MANSMTLKSYSDWEVSCQTPTTYSWETMWTEVTTQWSLSPCWSHSRCDTQIGWRSLEEIMKVDKLHRYMGFMMSVWGSMATPMSGNVWRSCLITYHWQRWFKGRYSVCMEGFRPALIHSIKSNSSIECRKFHMKALYVTFYGRTLMIAWVGAFLQEVRDTPSDKT